MRLVECVALQQDLGLRLEPLVVVVVLGLEDEVEIVAGSGRFVAAHLVSIRRQRVPAIDAEPRVDRLVLPCLQRRRLSLQSTSAPPHRSFHHFIKPYVYLQNPRISAVKYTLSCRPTIGYRFKIYVDPNVHPLLVSF